jgi:hypothetical protein
LADKSPIPSEKEEEEDLIIEEKEMERIISHFMKTNKLDKNVFIKKFLWSPRDQSKSVQETTVEEVKEKTEKRIQ